MAHALSIKRNITKSAIVPYGYLAPTIILLVGLMVIPISMVIAYSFFDNVIMISDSSFVGFENYKVLFKDPVFYETLGNTAYFTIMSVVFHMVLGLSFAVLLNSKYIKQRTKYIFRVIYILPWVFTATIIAVLWRLMLNPNGIINYILLTTNVISNKVEWLSSTQIALQSLTFINIWAGYPFFMVSILAGLQGIPIDLYEAATIDGAGSIKSFFFITIPQLLPIISSMAMLDIIWTMQQFPLVWMTTGGGPVHATEMLSTYTYKQAFSSYQFSMASTSAVVILLLSMFVAVFYFRSQNRRA